MAKKTQGVYAVNAWLTVCASIKITASSLQDAAAKAEKLQAEDFITFNDEFMDGRAPRIAWITDESAEPND